MERSDGSLAPPPPPRSVSALPPPPTDRHRGVDAPLATDAATDAADDERAQRWASRVVALVCLASLTPFAYYVGTRHRNGILSWLNDRNATSLLPEPSADPAEALREAATTASYAVAFIGLGAFVVTMVLRRRATQRLVRRAVASRSVAESSRSLLFTVVGWAVLFVAGALGGAFLVAGDQENTSDIAQHFIDRPSWIALVIPGFLLAVTSSEFFHRLRHLLRPLRAAGLRPTPVAVTAVAGSGAASGIREGLRSFVRAAVIQALSGVFLYIQWRTADEPIDMDDFLANRVFGVTLQPAIYAGVFLLLFAIFRPTRWIVRASLSQPLTIASLALITAGFVLAALGASLVVSSVAIVLGGLIGSITGLYVQDLGPQPFLGVVFLVFMFASSFHDGDSFVLPTGVVAWLLVGLTTAYALYELRKHWHAHPLR